MERRGFLLLLFVAAVLLVAARIHLPFLEPEEGRYAEIPRQMLSRGDWIIPHYDGEAYLDKPPLIYWLNMLSYRAFGANTIVARLPSCLIAFATCLVVAWWARTIAGPTAMIPSVLALLTCPDFLYRGPMLTPNGLLTLCVATAWAFAQNAIDAKRLTWWTLAASATALGILAKGPVALVIVGLPVFIVLMLRTDLGSRRLWIPPAFCAAAVAFASPWFIVAALDQPKFVEYFFWKHHVQRAVAAFDHDEPFWYYLPRVLWGAGPWIVVLIAGRASDGETDRHWRVRLPDTAVITTLAFLSCVASKRPAYLLPVYPAIAVSVGVLWSRLSWPRLMPATIGLLALFAAGSLFGLPWYHQRFSLREFVAAIPEESAQTLPIICYPHDWPSVGFDLARADLMTFPRGQEEHLRSVVDRCGSAILILKSGKAADELIHALEASHHIETLAENLIAVEVRVIAK